MPDGNDAIEQLKNFKKELDQELEKYLSEKISEAEKIAPDAKALQEHIFDLTLRGGKRIRAALMYYSYIAHSGLNLQEALRASMAMEMSETFLLTHDDIIDNGSLRRGRTTIHTDYEEISKKRFPGKIDPKHFGISMAIMAGDSACAISNQIIAHLNFPSETRIRAIQELNNTYLTVIYGESLDVISELEDNVKKDEILLIDELKTASYTFNAPLKLGAILAGASEDQIKCLEKYTIPLGIAFQIQDDIIGMFGTEEKLGKPVASDLIEGKRTLLILDSLEIATEKQKNIIEKNLGNKKVTAQDLEDVRKVIIETGALEKSKKLAQKLVTQAYEALDKCDLKNEGKEFLLGIASYMINREY